MHRHLVMFASLFLFLWAAISIGCSSKSAEESSDSSAPSSKSASLFGPKEVTLPAGTVITVRLASAVGSKTSNTGDHYCPAISRTESIGCRDRVNRSRSRMLEVPVKWAFSRKASRSKSVESGRGWPPVPSRLRTMATST